MSRRKRNAISPTLFPFLAVLVCTLGTLILLLALVAREAKTTAQQKQETPAPPPTHPLTAKAASQLIADEQFRAKQLVSFRQEQTDELQRRRDELTHLEVATEALKDRLRKLRDEVQLASETVDVEEIAEETLVLLQEEIEDEQQAVDELKEELETGQPRVVIVPHKGPNGTDRRAIYVECTADGVTIWPEGVTITPVQMADTTRDANPLDAALRAVRYHVAQNYGDAAPPYPLLIVRPDGTETYALARMAMQDWDDQFGYELVPDDIELAFPAPDAQLKEALQVAIRRTVASQRVRYAGLGRSGGRGGPLGVSRSGTVDNPYFGDAPTAEGGGDGSGPNSGGGDSYAGSTKPAKPLPVLSAAELDRQGQARGYQDFAHAGSITSTYDTRSDIDRIVDSIPRDSATIAGSDSTDLLGGQAADGRSAETHGSSAAKDPPSLARSGEDTAGQPFDASMASLGSPQQSQSQSDTGSPSSNDASDNFQLPGESDVASATPSTMSGQNAQASASPAASMQRPGATPSSETPPDQDPSQPASPSVSASLSPQQSPVQRMGRNWALPDAIAQMRGTEVVRPIPMHCYHDRFVLVDTVNPSRSQTFRFANGDINSATMKLAAAIRDRVATWGTSLPGGRWQPRLEVQVMPYAAGRYDQLRTLLHGSGVEVHTAGTSNSTIDKR
ncbi:hypothetical protein [Crateriforma conspicua]|uniref:IncA protein n=1 Tax=Crateriforma conspicua TaxID=2527996 RepID=A0A5C5Y7X7_9PLAN|nr:hypothetical protein [Crateriforma conspicua]TWT71079.1 hypothetical protein Pan14r_33890 [Crateriforma conspicua]